MGKNVNRHFSQNFDIFVTKINLPQFQHLGMLKGESHLSRNETRLLCNSR